MAEVIAERTDLKVAVRRIGVTCGFLLAAIAGYQTFESLQDGGQHYELAYSQDTESDTISELDSAYNSLDRGLKSLPFSAFGLVVAGMSKKFLK